MDPFTDSRQRPGDHPHDQRGHPAATRSQPTRTVAEQRPDPEGDPTMTITDTAGYAAAADQEPALRSIQRSFEPRTPPIGSDPVALRQWAHDAAGEWARWND